MRSAEMTGKSAGLELLERYGFEVFPIRGGYKFPPLVIGGCLSASDDPEIVAEWSDEFSGCNWGIHCRDLLVVDVDAKKDGIATAKGLDLPGTLTAKTPGGGYHLFYRKPGGVKNSVGLIGQGVDIRSNGGYVVAVGSVVSGKRYTWVRGEEIADAPPWLVEKCGAAREKKANRADDLPDVIDTDEACRKAETWLEFRDPAIEGSGGDEWTYKTLARLRDLAVPRDRVMEVLADWNERCEPPWDDEELERKVENVWKYAQNDAGSKASESDYDFEDPPEPDYGMLYSPATVKLSDVLANDYIVKGWLHRRSQALMFGRWSAGKTFCALSMAAHVAAGQEWFGNKVRQTGVLYLNYEGAPGMAKRLWALRHSYSEWNWHQVPFFMVDMEEQLVNRDKTETPGMRTAKEALTAYRKLVGELPGLIIVDTLRDALGGSDSDVDLTSAYKEFTRKMAKKMGITVLTVHHPGHGDSSRGRGDSGIEAGCDSVIRVDADLYEIKATKQRDGKLGLLHYDLATINCGQDADGDTVTTKLAVPRDPNAMELSQPEKDFLTVVCTLADDGLFKPGVIKAETMAREIRDKILGSLVQKGRLEKVKDGYRIMEGADDIF